MSAIGVNVVLNVNKFPKICRLEVTLSRRLPILQLIGAPPSVASSLRERLPHLLSLIGIRLPGLRVTFQLSPQVRDLDPWALDVAAVALLLAALGKTDSALLKSRYFHGGFYLDGSPQPPSKELLVWQRMLDFMDWFPSRTGPSVSMGNIISVLKNRPPFAASVEFNEEPSLCRDFWPVLATFCSKKVTVRVAGGTVRAKKFLHGAIRMGQWQGQSSTRALVLPPEIAAKKSLENIKELGDQLGTSFFPILTHESWPGMKGEGLSSFEAWGLIAAGTTSTPYYGGGIVWTAAREPMLSAPNEFKPGKESEPILPLPPIGERARRLIDMFSSGPQEEELLLDLAHRILLAQGGTEIEIPHLVEASSWLDFSMAARIASWRNSPASSKARAIPNMDEPSPKSISSTRTTLPDSSETVAPPFSKREIFRG
jgi:hypothetical protein